MTASNESVRNFDGNVTYTLHSAWPGRPAPAAEIGRKFLDMLALLEPLDPSFRGWMTRKAAPTDWEDPDEPPPEVVSVASVESELGDWVTANMRRNDWCEPWPEAGYGLSACSDYATIASGAELAKVGVSVGSVGVDHGEFEIGSEVTPPDPRLATHAIYRGATLAVAAVWKAPWANVRVWIWGQRPPTLPGEPPFPYSGYQMPWISYLCAERAAKLGPLPDLITERTPDGGLLMSATLDRFDPANLAHMRCSRQMAEIMIEHGGNPSF
ncbi:MAG TPA: hypothetical protein VGI95_13040 [Caulobacteraceae bacterium]|jgi:hypothetical protein